MKRLAILALLALSACGQHVQSVPVPCVRAADVPAETPGPILTGNAVVDAAILARYALSVKSENVGLRAVVKPCLR